MHFFIYVLSIRRNTMIRYASSPMLMRILGPLDMKEENSRTSFNFQLANSYYTYGTTVPNVPLVLRLNVRIYQEYDKLIFS